MKKRVLVISSSMRKSGNSDALADEFLRGASDAGHETEKLSLIGKTLAFCKGCLACAESHRCVMRDDADIIREKMKNADVIAFATPIYYYEMSGQMKTVLDRANPLYGDRYRFRDIYLLAAAADDGESTPERAENGLKGWVECFPEAAFRGTVFAGGVDSAGSISGHPALKKAYEAGKNV